MPPIFRYYTGEDVRLGDRVKTGSGHLGIVTEIIDPQTQEATDFRCQQGGVLIAVDWDGALSNIIMTPPDGVYWEDIYFQERIAPENVEGTIGRFLASLKK